MTQLQSVLDPLAEAFDTLGPPPYAVPNLESVGGGSTRVVIFGSGHLGKLVLAGATGAGLNVLAFTDNNPAKWGQCIEGIAIISPQIAVHRYSNEAFFVAAIHN